MTYPAARDRFTSRSRLQFLFHLFKHECPCCIVLFSRFFIWKSRVRQLQMRSLIMRREFNRNNCFCTFCSSFSRNLGHLDQPIVLKPQKPAIVRMTLPFVMCFKEVWRVDFSFHQD